MGVVGPLLESPLVPLPPETRRSTIAVSRELEKTRRMPPPMNLIHVDVPSLELGSGASPVRVEGAHVVVKLCVPAERGQLLIGARLPSRGHTSACASVSAPLSRVRATTNVSTSFKYGVSHILSWGVHWRIGQELARVLPPRALWHHHVLALGGKETISRRPIRIVRMGLGLGVTKCEPLIGGLRARIRSGVMVCWG